MIRRSSPFAGVPSSSTRSPRWSLYAAVLGLFALWGSPVVGQQRSLLSLLDPAGRILSVGGPGQSGALVSDDFVTTSGRRVQAWTLEPIAGPVRVDLSSDDFDAYLYVLGDGSAALLEDDDSGGDLNSRICLDQPGSYTVIAASLGGDMGSFRLEASPEPEGACPPPGDGSSGFDTEVGPALAAVVPQGAVEVPGSETFRFDGTEPRVEGRLVRGWTFRGEEGERFALTHRAPGVDTYLYLTGPGLPEALRDDDSAGDFDARLCVRLPESGEYTVYAAPFSPDEEGALHRLETAQGDDAEMACEGSFSASPAVVVERLLALDVEGRSVAVGDEVTGVLTMDQPHPESGEPLQAWRLEAAAGTRVFVDVVSRAFDATVRAAWPGLDEELMNDDFGEGCNSRLDFIMPSDGPVTVFPGSWSSTGQGEFMLRVSTDPGPLEAGGCGGGGEGFGGMGAEGAAWEMVGRFTAPSETLRLGTEMVVELEAGNSTVVQGVRARAWELETDEPGDWIVEAISDDVDPVLYVMGPTLDQPLFDDDSAGALDARIEVVGPEPGSWVIVVGALGEAQGSVRLRVLRRAGGG